MKFPMKMAMLVAACLLLTYLQYNGDDGLRKRNADAGHAKTSCQKAEQKCQASAAAANIVNFDSFPESMKKFLSYRHCRCFPLLLDSPGKCGGAHEIFLLLVIKSSPGNYERREVLRKTWAEERELGGGAHIRRLFISGTAGNGSEKIRLNKLLQFEQREHQDIVQWDFEDTHCNLTLKQVLLMGWLKKNCPHASFLLNGDDDMFAHTENIVAYLQSLGDPEGGRHLFAGYLQPDSKPLRDVENKYFIPPEIYRSDFYPPFCSGGGILLSRYTALVLHTMAQLVPLFPLDDVYLGILLHKARLNLTLHTGVMTFGLEVPPESNVDELDPCLYKDLLLVHRFLPTELYIMWHRVHDPDLKCSF